MAVQYAAPGAASGESVARRPGQVVRPMKLWHWIFHRQREVKTCSSCFFRAVDRALTSASDGLMPPETLRSFEFGGFTIEDVEFHPAWPSRRLLRGIRGGRPGREAGWPRVPRCVFCAR